MRSIIKIVVCFIVAATAAPPLLSAHAQEPTPVIVVCQFSDQPVMVLTTRGGMGADDNSLQVGSADPVQRSIGSSLSTATFDGAEYVFSLGEPATVTIHSLAEDGRSATYQGACFLVNSVPPQARRVFDDASANEPGPVDEPAPEGPAERAQQPTDTGDWRNALARDAMTDFENSTWYLNANDRIDDGLLGVVRPQLLVRCLRDRTSVIVNWNRYVTTGGLDGEHRVSFRIDTQEVVSGYWSMSTDYEATFSRNPVEMLRSLSGAQRLIVETIPYASPAAQVAFNIAGIDAVIADVSARCHWIP